MKCYFEERNSGGRLQLVCREAMFDRLFFLRDRDDQFLTIAWNTGRAQQVAIDEVSYSFPSRSVLPLVIQHSFRFERPEDIIAWQFNRDFYCIADHDHEVSCAGFLFYHSQSSLFIRLNRQEYEQLGQLKDFFIEEYGCRDHVQGEMLRVLLKRLIIKLTRIARQQQLPEIALDDPGYHLLRKFNLLVEMHYRESHLVSFYAKLLNKSPKTLANYFALHKQPSPLQVIHNRIVREAKRLLIYTDQSAKEVAYYLGFEEASNFSRLFKKATSVSPVEFRQHFFYKR